MTEIKVGLAVVACVKEPRVDLMKMNEGGTTENPSLGTALLYSLDKLGGTAMSPRRPLLSEARDFLFKREEERRGHRKQRINLCHAESYF